MQETAQIIGQLATANIEVFLLDGKLKARALKGGLSQEYIALIKNNKQQIIAYLSQQNELLQIQKRPKIIAINRESKQFVSSYAQQRLWFIDKMDGASSHYNMNSVMHVAGDFNLKLAASAYTQIIQRHETLRTYFVEGDDGPLQVIREQFDFNINIIEISDLLYEEGVKLTEQEATNNFIKKNTNTPFDLTKDLMLRVNYIRLSDKKGVLLFNMHHIAADGWSFAVLVNEFITLYSSELKGIPCKLKPLTIQYVDYALWQRNWLSGKVLERQLKYWAKQLAELPAVHNLPLDFKRPTFQTFNGRLHRFNIDSNSLKALEKLALQNQVTLFMLIHALFSVLLSRYSNSSDIVIGTPIANRLQKELEGLIGFFVNTLVLRADCKGDLSFLDFLQQIKTTNLNAQSNQDVPFEHLVECLKPARNTSYNALFQIMLSMDTNEGYEVALPDVKLTPQRKSQINAKFDLVLETIKMNQDGETHLQCTFEYNTDLFSEQTIKRMADSLQQLVSTILLNVNQPIAQLSLIGETEKQFLLHTLNNTQADYPQDLCIHQIFEKQVENTPKNIAVVFKNQSLTYLIFNQRSNQLARYLLKQGVKPDELIGLYMGRSLEIMIGIMAVLKAGAAYLPLDPNLPQNRLYYMIEDSGLKIILTHEIMPEIEGNVKSIILDNLNVMDKVSNYSSDNLLLNNLKSSHLAYVIYTSGSTGKPKGVMIEHGNAVHSVYARKKYYQTPVESFLLISPIAFDSSLAGLMWTLLFGGKLIIANNEAIADPDVLINLINQHAITHTLMTPVLYSALLLILKQQQIKSLKTVIIAGESFADTLPQNHHKLLPETELYNEYGPTEACVWTSAAKISVQNNRQPKISIGKAISNTKLYVLGENQELLPHGTTGELYIAGAGLARGYLNQQELTKQSFIQLKINKQFKQRVYRTGDLVRYLDDGNLVFIDRIDSQVKIHGFRIELGEIQHQLNILENIQTSLVMVYGQTDEKRLVAYICSQSPLNKEQLIEDIRKELHKQLPDYMIPAIFIIMDKFPLTSNGKIDRKKLPQPDNQTTTKSYQKPMGNIELGLVEIWSTLLKISTDKISADAHFFELGGHSLLSIKLLAEIRSKFACELSIRDIFATPQLSLLAQNVQSTEAIIRPKVTKHEKIGDQLIPSFAQQRLWFIDQMDGGSAHYNMPSAMRLHGDFKVDVAQAAFAQIIDRHQILRTVFKDTKNGPVQIINKQFNFKITLIDLSDIKTQKESLDRVIKNDASQSFDLSKDLMLRVNYIRISNSEGVLLFNIHHIASDGWSIGLLVDEFINRYSAILKGDKIPLPKLSIQYADYAYWQRNWLQGGVLQQQLDYWSQQLKQLPQVHNLPLDFERPQVQTFNGALHHFVIDSKISKSLNDIALENQVTLFMLIHAMFSILLSRYSNSTDIVIATPVANRLQKELEPIIGFFINTLVLRVDCSNNPDFTTFLKQVKNTNLDAQVNQDVPFEHLVDKISPVRSTAHNALFQIMLSMDNNEKIELNLPDVKLSPQINDHISAKFDLILNIHQGDELNAFFQYNTDLFSAKTMAGFAASMQMLFESIVRDRTQKINQIAMISEKHIDYLLTQLNNTKRDYSLDLCIHQLFEQQAQVKPHVIAITFKQQSMTYAELNTRANQLAHFLIELGTKPEDIIGLCLDRSIEMIIGLLAILKAGAAYLPLDPDYPDGRITHMIKDSQLKLILTQQHLISVTLNTSTKQLIMDASSFLNNLTQYLDINPVVKQLNSNNLAYIIYTSGSTGKPKGVLQTHRTIVNLVQAQGLNQAMTSLQFAPLVFDVSIQEIATSWYTASTMVIISNQAKQELNKLPKLLKDYCIERLFLPPVVLNWLAEELLKSDLVVQLKEIIVAGEALIVSKHLKQYLTANPDCHLWNHYGPTETHVATIAKIEVDKDGISVPIGSVISNLSAFILDTQCQLLPYGAVGELYLAGAGLARGYLNQPQLTTEKFISHPFKKGKILYHTGDLVRYLNNGQLAYMGRTDQQIQIRGFRVELGEIESQLSTHDAVQNVMLSIHQEHNEKRLVAYVCTNSILAEDKLIRTLQAHLQQYLPDYMIPNVFILLKHFPLTKNGKIDRNKLPKPTMQEQSFIAPSGNIELALAKIWCQLLKVAIEDISANANFFELGGHSLLSIRLLAEIGRAFDRELTVRDIFNKPQLSDIAKKINQSILSKRTLISTYERADEYIPTSYAQQRLWFIEHMSDGNSHYNLPSAMRIEGDFRVDIAEQTFKQILQRHEVLRTVFVDGSNGPMQKINKQFNFNISIIDLTSLSSELQIKQIDSKIKKEIQSAFDLSRDLMLRVSYFHLKNQQGILLFNMHHIASDGWSMGILVKEFVTIYKSILRNKPNPLQALNIQYCDYVMWQKQWLQGHILDKQLSYWQQQLADLPQVHNLPLDHERPTYQTFNGAAQGIKVDQAILTQLKAMAAEQQVTLFMLLHAVFSLLLSRYSNSHDIVIGTPVANRTQKELEQLIGFFVNTLVLRTDCSNNPTFVEFLQQIKIVNLDAQSNQDIPFEQLVDHLNPPRNTNHNALFQIMMAMNTNEKTALELPEVTIKPYRMQKQLISVKFDLVLMLSTTDDGLFCHFEYNSDIFSSNFIERMADSFNLLLQGIVANKSQLIAELPILTTKQIQYQLYDLNKTRSEYSSESCIHELIEQQAEKFPNATALVFAKQTLNYQQFNIQVNQLAHYLLSHKVKPDDIIGICIDRSMDMIIALLAILKAGAAYLPLDPDYPKERLKYMIQDSKLSMILTHKNLLKITQEFKQKKIILDDRLLMNKLKNYPEINPVIEDLNSSHLAYVIYTSGSTGNPKGVMIEHKTVVNLAHAQSEYFTVDTSNKVLQFASLNFDITVWEWTLALTNGASLYICDQECRQDVKKLEDFFCDNQISNVALPPAYLNLLSVHRDYGFKHLTVGGEALEQKISDKWSDKYKLYNGYGPTEVTVCSTISRQYPHHRVNIGKPMYNYTCYILDHNKSLLPIGSIGELYLGGESLARGYLNQIELTAERFISHRFEDNKQERLYRTGDLVRYMPDGNIEFIGRIDSQIKIRGFRIELGEIEAQLLRHTDIKTATVIVIDQKDTDKYLAAFIVTETVNIDKNKVIRSIYKALKKSLPNHMIPASINILDALPLTLSNKVDNKALAALDSRNTIKIDYLAPKTKDQKILINILSDILAIAKEKISMHHNFFDIGGNSLSLILVTNQLKKAGLNINIKQFYESASLIDIFNKQDNSSHAALIKLNDTQIGAAIYLIHPMGGRVDCYNDLASNIGDTQVYGIQAPFTFGDTFEYTDLIQLAQYYVQVIISNQPTGPYRLGGWSVGGLIAQQMVQVLNSMGETVEDFVALDSFMIMPSAQKKNNFEALKEIAAFAIGEKHLNENFYPKDIKSKEFTEQLEITANILLLDDDSDTSQQQVINGLKFGINFLKAKISLSPQTISKKAVLFIAQENPDKALLLKGWEAAIASETEFVEVEGKHLHMLEGDSLLKISNKIKDGLC